MFHARPLLIDTLHMARMLAGMETWIGQGDTRGHEED